MGRIPLYLLDTTLEENSPADRDLTARLYINDPETRIVQEILLGIGGVRALRVLGEDPSIWHMNEGHSAFLTLERLREQMSQGVPFEEAKDIVRVGNIFTTHTPVPAGNDVFQSWLVEKFFSQFWTDMKITRDQFVELARASRKAGANPSDACSGAELSSRANGVSELHGRVSRQMWHLWPEMEGMKFRSP